MSEPEKRCRHCCEVEADCECRYCERCNLDAGFDSEQPHCETMEGERLCTGCWF